LGQRLERFGRLIFACLSTAEPVIGFAGLSIFLDGLVKIDEGVGQFALVQKLIALIDVALSTVDSTAGSEQETN
jgi:hypothetical protein